MNHQLSFSNRPVSPGTGIGLLPVLMLIVLLLPICCFGKVRTGAERMETYLPLLKDKRIALVMNHTSVVGGRRLSDTLAARGIRLTALFTPEHGLDGRADAGETVGNATDRLNRIPVYSLYGQNKKPTEAQLKQADIVLFDLQDVGARFYTYISTLYYVMQACAENGKTLIVLDKPNPCDHVAGPVREEGMKSFVGVLPIPVLHGCTMGELAQMINGEGWLGKQSRCDVKVITAGGWRHGEAYRLPVKPSPNLPDERSVAFYASLCPFEGTSVSVGRGTTVPFRLAGSPLLSRTQNLLTSLIPHSDTVSFRPQSLAGWDKNPLHKDRLCYGVSFDNCPYPSQGFDLNYVVSFYRAYVRAGKGDSFFTRPRWFDLLMGTSSVRNQILKGMTAVEIEAGWQAGLEQYSAVRKKYLLYP